METPIAHVGVGTPLVGSLEEWSHLSDPTLTDSIHLTANDTSDMVIICSSMSSWGGNVKDVIGSDKFSESG